MSADVTLQRTSTPTASRVADSSKAKQREGWIDCVKGITITMVVAHHVLEGLNNSLDLPNVMYWYAVLSPVRMPLFFLVAGFFARASFDAPLGDFVNKKVLSFGYLYLLWSAIIFALRLVANPVTNNQTHWYAYSWFFGIRCRPSGSFTRSCWRSL